MMVQRRHFTQLAGLSLVSQSFQLFGQDQSGRIMRIIVPFPVGGASDTLARTLSERIGKSLDRRVIIENKPGAGTVIATQSALALPADGNTILLVAASFVVQPQLISKPPYDVLKDFSPIALAAGNPHLLVIHPSVPARNFSEFINWARSRNGEASYASFGNGTSGHLGFELLMRSGNFRMTHIPYRGGSPAMQDLLAGQVSAMMTDLPQALPFVKDRKLRAIAVGSAKPDATLPDVPTFIEVGLSKFQSHSWFGFVSKAGTHSDIVKTLNVAFNNALEDPAIRKSLGALGLTLFGGTSEDFSSFLKSEFSKYKEAIQLADIKPD